MSDPPEAAISDKSSGRLALAPELPLDGAVIESLESVVGYALRMVGLVDEDSVEAVHRYRKSLRRTRALLRLLRPILGKANYDRFVSTLQGLMRPTSVLRDVDVLISTCTSLEADERVAEGVANVRAVLEAHQRELVEDSLAEKTLARGVEPLSALLVDLTEALVVGGDSKKVLSEQIIAGFDATWRRAQKAGRRAQKRRTDNAIHRWRTRVKEVRYQLELLAEPEGGPVENIRGSLGDLAQRLGTITDLIALRRYVDDHRSAISPEDVERVDRVLAELIRERFDRAGSETYDIRRRIDALSN